MNSWLHVGIKINTGLNTLILYSLLYCSILTFSSLWIFYILLGIIPSNQMLVGCKIKSFRRSRSNQTWTNSKNWSNRVEAYLTKTDDPLLQIVKQQIHSINKEAAHFKKQLNLPETLPTKKMKWIPSMPYK